MLIISCNNAAMVPNECHSMGARSGTTSRFFDNSSRAASLVSGEDSSIIHWYILSRSTFRFWLDPVGFVVGVAWVVVGAEVVGLGGAEPVTGELLDTADMIVAREGVVGTARRKNTNYKNTDIVHWYQLLRDSSPLLIVYS